MSIKAFWKHRVLNFFDPINNPEFKIGLWANCPVLAIQADPSIATVLLDDFFTFDTTKWARTVYPAGAPGGTVGIADAVEGIYNTYCDGDDNDEAYVVSEGQSWLMATGKPLWFEAKFTFTNSATTAGVFCVGITDTEENMMLDDEGGPAASYDGFVFYKESGDANLNFETSLAGAQVENATLNAFTSGTTYRLGIYYDGVTTITPYVDDVAKTAHTMATNTSEGSIIFGTKSNGAEEFIAMNYIKVVQMR
ncbi:hypothetical protein LCGC14_0421380 [marine sediment metagenome]|uniref:Uncharacterized protein n=1 Tax=marine sediment metagenome TaxID=412755 RepID=A0A0F9VCX7_9ZZZZ